MNAQDKDDLRLVAVIRDVARIDRRLAGVDTQQQQIAAAVDGLARAVGTPPEDEDEAGQPSAVRAWLLTADPDLARADLADLIEWLDRVYLRYAGAALPSCWCWHPAVIEELRWLCGAHAGAYEGEDASWTRAGDWHDRLRPGVVARIQTAIGGCELALHRHGETHAGAAPTAALAGSADQIAGTWATDRASPEPTETELAEAERYDREQTRTRR